jgi:NAD(P)-dependent dehydrogenase (short-subunit alcohol dehydrogenase family)
MKLSGKAILITGASRGLGAALMQSLAAAGARVVGVARDAAALERVVAHVRAAGHEAHAVVADVAARDAAARIAGLAGALVGPVDVLVHNASSLGPVPLAPLSDIDDAAFDEAFATNVSGPFRLTRAVAGAMALRGGGLVVHISSDAAVSAYATWGPYGASKSAFDQLMRVWAAELAQAGVRFVSLDPGEMNTRMHRDAVPDADPATLLAPEQVAERVTALLAGDLPAPFGRLAVSS